MAIAVYAIERGVATGYLPTRALELQPELHALVWSSGADFVPAFLREKLLVGA